jgi:hypothetical protein
MLAAARVASTAATGAAAEESGNEAGLTAVTAVAAVASGAIVSPGTAVAGSSTRVAGVNRGGGGLTARPLPLVGGGGPA